MDNIDSLLSLAAGVPNISIERFDEKHSHLINIFTVSKYTLTGFSLKCFKIMTSKSGFL